MKKVAIVLLALLCVLCLFTACNDSESFTLTSTANSYTFTVGQSVDFKSFFTLTNKTGENIPITDDMIDAPEADLTKVGEFFVTCSYQDVTKTVLVSVKAEGEIPPSDGDTNPPSGGDDTNPPSDVTSSATIDLLGVTTRTSYSTSKVVHQQNGITVTIDKANAKTDCKDNSGNATYGARVYASGTLTIEHASMTKIVITCDSGTYNNKTYYSGFEGMSVAGATITLNGAVTTITFDSATDKFVSAELSSQVRINSIQVFFVSDETTDGEVTPPSGGDDTNSPSEDTTVDLSDVFANYDSYDEWNFELEFTIGYTGETESYFYGYDGKVSWLMYDYDGTTYTDYQAYEGDVLYLYADWGDGTYSKIDENDENFESYYFFDYLDLTKLSTSQFTFDGTKYVAVSPNVVGNNVLGEYTNSTYKYFYLYVANGQITKIEASHDDDYLFVVEFSKHDEVQIDLSKIESLVGDGASGIAPAEPTGKVMESQSYSAETHNTSGLREMMESKNYAVGIPTVGDVDVLVIPVQFSDAPFEGNELSNLNVALNGTSEQTGWESVKSYYAKSSYGKLNLSFDIQQAFTTSKTVANYTNSEDGSHDILLEALAWVEDKVNLADYDSNNDGLLDAIYLIYSCDINRTDENSIWWAFVSWSQDQESTFDGVNPYCYLFAGIDFMTEGIDSTMKIDATTYIHETGHVLGLDDYYDYYDGVGSDMGLGDADMMDYTIGDHNAYSKIMLGWITPTVITDTQQITLEAFATTGQCLMILLDYDGTYFSEYLLVDLYTNTGLYEYHSSVDNTLLYGSSTTGKGATYGARIYHVSSNCDTPFNDNYGSFTTNNNSLSRTPLIRLIEADGEKNYDDSDNDMSYGNACAEDLWQSGSSLKEQFEGFTRYNGDEVNFDISFDSVTASGATITITFLTAE